MVDKLSLRDVREEFKLDGRGVPMPEVLPTKGLMSSIWDKVDAVMQNRDTRENALRAEILRLHNELEKRAQEVSTLQAEVYRLETETKKHRVSEAAVELRIEERGRNRLIEAAS